jgi:hypothetical protein
MPDLNAKQCISYISTLLKIRRRQSLNCTSSIHEPCAEYTICVLEHAILQADNNELRPLESGLDETSNILSVRKIQRRVNFVKNVHWRWLELEKRHDE